VSSLVQRNKVIAKRKGAFAAVAVTGAAVAAVASAPIAAVVGLAAGAYLGWDWISFRIKNGMRF
jgi:tryptophan synthase beta subunit